MTGGLPCVTRTPLDWFLMIPGPFPVCAAARAGPCADSVSRAAPACSGPAVQRLTAITRPVVQRPPPLALVRRP